MVDENQIVAYIEKGVWHTFEEVQEKRAQRSPELVDALPYTVKMLRRRQEFGRDVPDWIDLNEDPQPAD